VPDGADFVSVACVPIASAATSRLPIASPTPWRRYEQHDQAKPECRLNDRDRGKRAPA
jgi:hypothetical protein